MYPITMLIAIATGIRAMTRVVNWLETQLIEALLRSWLLVRCLACHVRGGDGERADALDEPLEEARDVRVDADLEVWRLAPAASPVGHRLAGRQGATELHLHR